MSRRSVDIDRLEIRLTGVSPESARAAVADLGREVLDQLARQDPGSARIRRMDHVDSGTVRLASGTTPSELRRTIAGRISDSINSKPR